MTKMSIGDAYWAASIPSLDVWPDISVAERSYRARVLGDIALRVAEEGMPTAAPGDERGRQFMPFAALKGYEEAVKNATRPDSGDRDDQGPEGAQCARG